MKKIIFTLITLFILPVLTFATNVTTNVSQSLNGFAFNLYNQIKQTDANMVFSPYSLSSLLGVLTNGAAGDTRTQLLKVLNIDSKSLSALNAQTDELTSNINNFIIANALWGDKSYTYKKSFTDTLAHYKNNHFYSVDFLHNPHAAVQTINDWVNKNTRGYIPDIISASDISDATRLVLTNAIYFKGLWQRPFEKSATVKKAFTLTNKTIINVPMMMQRDHFIYSENNIMQELQMNYAKSTLALMILLPKTGHTLEEIQKTLNPFAFAQLLNSSSSQDVIVSLPKFKLESNFDKLNGAMQTMGFSDGFSAKANFSNLSASPVRITDILQKALIQVDEEGTVAAAATSVMMAAKAMVPIKPQPPYVFNANHPFVFILFDEPSQTILFMGQLTQPS